MHKPTRSAAPPSLDLAGARKALATAVETYECKVVTPIYGGGVVAGQVDSRMPIRATAIRGQLRFFWRLAHAALFNADGKLDSVAMFAAERAIFGGLGGADDLAASKVFVRVRRTSRVSPKAAANYPKDRDGNFKTYPNWESWAGGRVGAYALFPAQGKAQRSGIETPPALLALPGLTFDLEIGMDGLAEEQREQVRTALRWWASFGSTGARGRRGLSAVHIRDCRPVDAAEARSAGCTLVLQNQAGSDPFRAWERALDALQRFRQGKGIGRNPGNEPNRPGRSRWPEPDAIRRIVGKNMAKHKPEHAAGNVFPRAYFGLPIIFHFKDEKAGDPQQSTLKFRDAERLASPVIVRPYWNGQAWAPAALQLPLRDVHAQMKQLVLDVKGHSHGVEAWPGPEHKDRRVELAAKTPPVHRIFQGRAQSPSPYEAFLNFFINPGKYEDSEN